MSDTVVRGLLFDLDIDKHFHMTAMKPHSWTQTLT